MGFSNGSVVKNLPANEGDARDADLIPGLRRSPAGGNGNPLPYSCLENPMDRGTRWATVHGPAKRWTQLNTEYTHTHTHTHTQHLLPNAQILLQDYKPSMPKESSLSQFLGWNRENLLSTHRVW